MQTHMIKHTGEKPHACAFCPAAFSQKGNLQSHIQRVHSEVNTIIDKVVGANILLISFSVFRLSCLLFLCSLVLSVASIDVLL